MSSLFSSFGRALKMIVNRPRYPLQPQKKVFILFFLHTENLNRKSGIIPCFLSQQYTWAPDNVKGLYSAASLTLPALSWEQVHQARGCFFGRVILCAVSEKHLFHIYTLSSSYVSRRLFFPLSIVRNKKLKCLQEKRFPKVLVSSLLPNESLHEYAQNLVFCVLLYCKWSQSTEYI